jgi:3-oxoadipate enol-lactonase
LAAGESEMADRTTSRIVELGNGDRFNIAIDGPADAPWIVLGNSLGTDLTLWQSFAASMAPRYRILRYDHRGHGNSVVSPAPYNMPQLVADCIKLMDNIGIDRAHYVGISMGAAVGWGLALHHSQRLLSMTACDGALAATPGRDWEDRLNVVRQDGLLALVEPTLKRWFTAQAFAADTPAVRHARDMLRATRDEGFIGAVNALQTFDYGRGIEAIQLPVLLVAGEHDGTRPAAMAADARRVPGARYQTIRGAGHLSNIDNAEEFNRIVGDFIDSSQARRGPDI